MEKRSQVTTNRTKGGMVVSFARGLRSIIGAFLGRLSKKDLYWSLITYLGEALGIAFFKTIGEVLFGMGDILRGQSSWYGKNESRTAPSSSSNNSYSSGYSAFASRPSSSYSSNSYNARNVPATTSPSSSFGSTEGLTFQGFSN